MRKRIGKILKYFCIVLILLLVGVFALNWYLKYRLENYLRGSLSEKVLKATDGVYRLDFENLSIGLVTGELLIEGITLSPDSALLKKDSLSHRYVDNFAKISVGSIYFKGVNLTWRSNYKKLNFDLFRIKDATIDLLDLRLSRADVATKDSATDLDLYAMISPYINELTVQKISLENSSVSYQVSDGDGFVSQYSLQNINFEANGFRLDDDSRKSGKLLYSDNFNFLVDKPQMLISNRQFDLTVDRMLFDTKDSIIQIKDVELFPKTKLWEQINKLPDSYLEGKIESVDVSGLFFERKQGNNYLWVKSFDINKPTIDYFASVRDSSVTDVEAQPVDTLNMSWSLYSIVAPLLKSVSISTIGVNDAKFSYSQLLADGQVDEYRLDRLNMEAVNFKVDSLSETPLGKRFLYSQGFAVEAVGIKGELKGKNYIVSADSMVLNTLSRCFGLINIVLDPYDRTTNNDFVQGSIRSIYVDSLRYDMGLEANLLRIDDPHVEYVRKSAKAMVGKGGSASASQGRSLWQQVSPVFNHLLVRRIEVNDGRLRYTDSKGGDVGVIENLYLGASDLLIDEGTVDSLNYFSACRDFDFRFSHLKASSKHYGHSLDVRQTIFSKLDRLLKIRALRVSPLSLKSGKGFDGKRYDVSVPLVEFSGLDFLFSGLNLRDLQVASLGVERPRVKIDDVLPGGGVNPFLRIDATSMALRGLSWQTGGVLDLTSVFVSDWYFRQEQKQTSRAKATDGRAVHGGFALVSGINVARFDMVNSRADLKSEGKDVNLSVPQLSFNGLSWDKRRLNLGKIAIERPSLMVWQMQKPMVVDSVPLRKSGASDIYKTLGAISDSIVVGEVDINDADFDLAVDTLGRKSDGKRLNNTRLWLSGLHVGNVDRSYRVDDLELRVNNFRYPTPSGFYTLSVDSITFSSRGSALRLDSIALVAKYPKMEFAYKNPRHKDWFDVRVGSIALTGIDVPRFVEDEVLYADSLCVDYVMLQNFKNQKIEIEHNIMPMIYEGLQKLPLKLFVRGAHARDFNVIYEELPRKGDVASRIVFRGMNGWLKGVTNIATVPDQFIDLDADGYFMGRGYFKARWLLPVSADYDCFLLDGQMSNFCLTDLNPILQPMAPVRIDDGLVRDVNFSIEGTSLGADIDMLMLYNDLRLTVEKGIDNRDKNGLLTTIANAVLRSDNPKKRGAKPRHPKLYVVRDPYHSTFNYLWQILQPPLVESVGISQRKQNFAKRVGKIIGSIKNFFKCEKASSRDKGNEPKKGKGQN